VDASDIQATMTVHQCIIGSIRAGSWLRPRVPAGLDSAQTAALRQAAERYADLFIERERAMGLAADRAGRIAAARPFMPAMRKPLRLSAGTWTWMIFARDARWRAYWRMRSAS